MTLIDFINILIGINRAVHIDERLMQLKCGDLW